MEDPLSVLMAQSKRKAREMENEVREGQPLSVYGKPLDEPIEGLHSDLPPREPTLPTPILSENMNYVKILTNSHKHKKKRYFFLPL